MTRFFTTTATVLLLTLPTYSQAQTTVGETGEASQPADTMNQTPVLDGQTAQSGDMMSEEPSTLAGDMSIPASDLIGHSVYIRSDAEVGADIATSLEDVPAEWEQIGEVGDVILSPEREIDSVALDVGGFLGMGEKNVQTGMDSLEFVTEADSEDSFFVVYTGDRSKLEMERDYDQTVLEESGYSSWTAQRETALMANDTGEMYEPEQAEATSDESAMSDDADPLMADAADSPLTSEELQGMPVIGSDGERVGEVSEIVLAEDGKIENLIVEVGGFLGIGEKPVAIPFAEIQVEENDGLADQVVRINSTEEELESMDAWES
ncbi:PRC-barrel domain-containing protein [Tropicimonas sediminicola]|uniref:PRC-barrel domain-containing protein n=1 Tax=Tropicimonas sediminicola TaxID=1031541 RepID=A0A239F9P9_9RHOB|nr:PRC-barrel domain-containing protein [Tropicimonas sediminicola]SNS53547.1 PRC-barrel domain-containing protein [Tropicimonas sediminicola]